jgi:putative membrane protein
VILSLKPDERERIDTAMADIERRTATEFSVVVTRVSDRYSLYPLVWAGLAALLVTAIVAVVRSELTIGAAILIQLPVLIALTLLFDWMPIRILLVPKSVKQARARQLAQREFAAHVACTAPRHRGVLLFVSLGERYVEIIADRETHALVSEGSWDKIVADFLATVKRGRVADGVLAAVGACGALLETHDPIPTEDQGKPVA